MKRNEGKCGCDPGKSKARKLPKRPRTISTAARERLRQTATPAPFKEIVWGMVPRIPRAESPMLSPRTHQQDFMTPPKTVAARMPWTEAAPFSMSYQPCYLTDCRLDLSAVPHLTQGLQELARASLAPLVYNQLAFWAPGGEPGSGNGEDKDSRRAEALLRLIRRLQRIAQDEQQNAQVLSEQGKDDQAREALVRAEDLRKLIIDLLVKLLGHEEWAVREAADEALRRMSEFGPSIMDDLKAIRDTTDDPEVRERLERIVADSEEEIERLSQEKSDLYFRGQLMYGRQDKERQEMFDEAEKDLQETRDDAEAARRDLTGSGVEERARRRAEREKRHRARVKRESELPPPG